MAKVAMILGPEFEDSEFRVPYDLIQQAGHQVTLIGTSAGETVRGKQGQEEAQIDAGAKERNPEDFDALVIPGGHAPDNLRIHEDVVSFVRRFAETDRPLAAVCHGPQLLIEADLVRGKKMTSWPSVKTDLQNAGANWVDEQVVRDGTFITSRNPGDLEAFSEAVVSSL